MVSCLSISNIEAFRLNTDTETSLQQELAEAGNLSKHEGPCAPSCFRMSPEIYWKLSSDPASLMAKADENCLSPRCTGCRRSSTGIHKTTMPDCTASSEVQDNLPETDAPLAQVASQVKQRPLRTHIACMMKAEKDEVCDYSTTWWCLSPARNLGDACRQKGKPLCCSRLADISSSDQTTQDEVVDGLDSAPGFVKQFAAPNHITAHGSMEAPASTEASVPVEDEGDVCADGHFQFQSITRYGATLLVCRNMENKRFAKKICCDKVLRKELAEKEEAIDACAIDVKPEHCSWDEFESNREHYQRVPSSYTCTAQYLCKVNKRDDRIVMGPVASKDQCRSYGHGLFPFKACVAVKKSIK